MDLNPSTRSPLSLSKSFYEDITKDIPSPVSRDFYDAVSKPAEAKQAPATPARYELASPGEIAETIGTVGEAVIRTPLQIAGAAASAIRGGSREAMADKTSFLTRIIDAANKDAEDYQKKYADNKVVIAPLTKLGLPDDINTGTITRFPQQAAFSAVSAGAGLAAGLGTAAVSGPAAPIAGRAAGMAASGGVAYRMQKDNSTQDLYKKLNESSMKTAGRVLSPDEWKTAYDKNEGSLIEQGISEAIPEAIGNLVGFELFFGAAKNVFGMQLAKTTIGKTLDKYGAGAVGKMLAEQATEQTTETWTQQWQHNIDVEMGLNPGETRRSWASFDDLRQSNKEVFADILLLSTVMGGAGLAGEHVKDKINTKKSAQVLKDVVAENKFNTIPNEFLPAMYEHAQELSDKRPQDKDLTAARDAFATEMDKRGIDFDMTSKFKEYLKLDAVVKTEGATGEDVALWASLRDEFKEKNISPDLYQEYLTYQSDINKALGISKLIATGKATDPQKTEYKRLTDSIVSKVSTFGIDPKEIDSIGGIERGGIARKPMEPAKGAARDILLGDEPAAKRKALTAKDILTEDDVDIQFEEDLTPEAVANIDKKITQAGTGGARKPLSVAGETPEKVLDITGAPGTDVAEAPSVFSRMPDEQLKGMADQGVKGAKVELVKRSAKPAPVEKAAADEGEIANLIGKISRGEISEDFEFPESYSPMNISNLWDDLYSVKDDIDTKNKPKLDALIAERNKLKSAKDAVSRARKKQIDEEMDALGSESGAAMQHAETAFASAQEKLGLKAVELLKKEGIAVSEKDQDDIYELVSVLSDVQQNERGWDQPILLQVLNEFKAAKKSAAEETPTVSAPEGLTTQSYMERMKNATTADEGRSLISQYQEEFASIEREAGLAHSIGKGGSGLGSRGYSTLTTKQKKEIVKNVTAKNPAIGKKLQALIADIDAAETQWESLLGREHPKNHPDISKIKAAGTGGARGPLKVSGETPPVVVEPAKEKKSAKQELDDEVKKYREAGHVINDHGVYVEPEKITIPFSKSSGREGMIDIAKGPDGKFRIGVHISKKYGDFEGSGHAPSIHEETYDTREEALRAGIDKIRERIKGDDPKVKAALKELAAFELASVSTPAKIVESETTSGVSPAAQEGQGVSETPEIKAAGTGGARNPKPKKTPKAPEPKKEEKQAPSSAEIKSKEEAGKAKVVKMYLLEHIDEAIAARTAYETNKTEETGPMHVIIDVPMDGKFVIVNDLEHLNKFRTNVNKMKVTAALNRLPQHSDRPTGKSTDLITKEAEAEVTDYWKKRGEFKEQHGAIPAYIVAAKERLATYEEIQRKVDAKEMSLKQLGEEAKAASKADNAGPDAWRDSWFGRTPTYRDLTDRIKGIEKEIRELEEQRPALEKTIREYYPGLAKEMFEGKAAEEVKVPEEKKEEALAKDSRRMSEAIRERTIEKVKPFLENNDEKSILISLERFANEATGEITSERLDTGGSHEKGGLSKEDRLYLNLWDAKKFAASVLEYMKEKGLIPKAEEKAATLPDLAITDQANSLPGHPEATYAVHTLKPDRINLYKVQVVIQRQTPFLSVDGKGMNAEEAYRKALTEYERKLSSKAPDDIKAAGTGGKRGPKAEKLQYLDELINYGGEPRSRGSVIIEMQKQGMPQKQIDAYMMGAKTIVAPDEGLSPDRQKEQDEISGRLKAQNEREAEFEYRKKHDALLEATDKGPAAEGFSLDDAKRFLSDLDAAPGDDPKARQAILDKYPELSTAESNPEAERKARLFSLSLDQVEGSYKQGYIAMPDVEEYLAHWNAFPGRNTEVYWEDGAIRQRTPKNTETETSGTGGKRGSSEASTPKEDAYTAAVGKIVGKADRAKDKGYEFAYGETEKGSELYWDMVGIFSGTSADRLVEAGITIRKSRIDVPTADIAKEVAEISDADLDVLLDMPETKGIAPKTTNEAVKNIFSAARDKQRGSIPAAQPKALDDILSAVAKEGVSGAGEALKGLYELFGGSSLKSFPGGIDEDTYAKAKPHFEAAFDHFIKVGKGLREFASTMIGQFGDAIRPYLKRFLTEKRDGEKKEEVATDEEGGVINLDENTGKGEGGARTRRKMTDQEKAEKEQKAAAAAERKEKKAGMGEFQNVGYVYDPEKLNQKVKDKTPKSAAKIILDEMVPGKIWGVDYPEESTPGVPRTKEMVQKYFLTFKEHLLSHRDRLRYSSGKSIEDKIEHWLNFRGGSIDKLKEWASEYGRTMQPVIDAFDGQLSITNIIGRLQDTILNGLRDETGRYEPYMDVRHSLTGIIANHDMVNKPNGLYNFLTDSWQNLLADENDILLSEINVNKRGRNKEVVRSGLADYRKGVELKKTENFQGAFGFNGVGFGEEGWINQEERNRVIPAAFDAFMDLAATIGAPNIGMSLGRQLAVQFANLGHKAKGAAAAYFPAVKTINFTRDNGDGTMAHEWGHGLQDLASQRAKDEIEQVVFTFFHIYDFGAGSRLVNDVLGKDSTFLKRIVSNKKQNRIIAVKEYVTELFEQAVRKETDYYSTAQQMDPDYTARSHEMWARAFEAYIYDTLPGKNNYLVNDFVAAGRVGGKAGVGAKLVYPAGKERETFNETIKYFLDGLEWDENGHPTLKDDYISIQKANELLLQTKLRELLAEVEDRYNAIWASEPSKDGYYWYRYDATSFGPMMQPDGYAGHDKGYTSEGQNGTGAVAYLTQLHPDDILDYKLSNIQYEGENPVYIARERGGINGSLSEDGTEALDEVPARPDGGTEEGGDIRSGDRGSGADGEGGTYRPGTKRGADGSSEGDGAEGVHPSPAGNYRITDPTLNDPKSVPVRFSLNLAAVKLLNLIKSENRTASSGTVTFGEAPPGGWTDADKVPENQRTIKASINEKDILAQYSGWGGMSELFSYNPTAAWAGKAELLKAELNEDEIRDAASSSTSAYYTPVPVGTFMWKLAQRLGFTNGVVLDPATGANGLFLGTMPADLAQGTALQGIEMDGVSARIATLLYGLASIENKPFQDVKKPNNRFDLTITNVPFENFSPTDLKHNKGGYRLHNYFINKMLNLTAPGALSMMITTSNTLDAVGPHLAEFAGKAQLVGAIRLPSGIYSSTQVATDILVFRKNIEGGKFVGVPVEEWTTTGTHESTGLTINKYFLKYPEMVAGKLEKITGRYGNESLRVVGEGDLQSNLERLAASFPDKIVEREAVKEAKSIDDIISAPGTIKEGGAYINDKGEVCEKLDGEEVKLPVATAGEQKKAEIVRLYVRILDQIRTLLRAQKTETDAKVIKEEQVKLKKWYDLFVKTYGPINAPKNADTFIEFTDSSWVIALEEYDPDTNKVTKLADIFTQNITAFAARPDRADTDHDALAMTLDEFGYPNLEYMARLRSSDVESVRLGVADKIVENPETGFLETIDEYLSGNVKRKLAVAWEMAASNPEYARNVALLEAAQPAEIPQHRITARIGASWIDPAHLTQFVRAKMNMRNDLHAVFNFNPVSNEWSMTFKGEEEYRKTKGRRGFSENKAETQRAIAAAKRSIEATTVWGTQRMDFFELMKCALMGKRPQVTFTVDRKQYLDEVATQAAEVKLQDIQLEFGRWLFAEAGRSDEAVKRFNDLINTSVPMNADGSHLTFPGKSMWMVTPKEKGALGITDALTFYPHQMNATWKYLKNGNLYLGHEVGTGKTVTMALIAMEAKRLRGKKKVLYVTLNDSTMGQAVQEIKNLYPMANILPVRVSTNEQRKQRSLQKIALNDFDIAIMRQQDLDRIGLSPESERVFIEEELLELREILEEAKREGARILEQDIQVQIHALEAKLSAPGVHDEAKRKNLFFDDLGIDLMIVDEAHKYKNIPYATRLTRITGLNPAGSPTAKDFFRKTQYLNAQFPKKDGIVLASGTALSNSIAEMYNIQRMLQPQEVKRQGVWSFDRWIANHGDMGSQLEWDGARAQYKVITTNRRIVNAGRLLATAYQNVDSVRAKDTPVKRPIIRGGEPQRVKVQPNQYVENYKQIILERCAAIEMDPKNAEYEGVPDNMLRIISNMSKVAIDQRLDHHYANTEMQQDSKIATASKIMYRRWQEEAKHKGVQLVFADLGIPGKYSDKFKYKPDDEINKLSPEDLSIYNEEKFEHESASTGFNTYEGLKKELVKLGIPENQIAFIHDADHSNKEKKAANLRSLFKKVNAGDIRVLIGSTSKAGTGVNIQGRVSDIHHLDVWWNYSAWEQRNGRGIRAGNLYARGGMPGTYIWNYVTETTVDATRWDKVFAKGKVLNAVLGGDVNLDVIEDISDETMSAKMMAAEASGDPLMSTQATLLQKVQGLRFEQAAHLDVVRRSRMDLAAIPGRIEALEKCIADYHRSRSVMGKVTAVRFIGDDRTLVLEKHGKEISEALEKAVLADTHSWTENKKAALLVFGSHTETEVTEEVEGKDGEKKERKVKKYTFAPLPAKADITGKERDPYGRRLLISGSILSSDRNLADIQVDERLGVGDKRKPTTADIKANVSRTVTEYLSYLNHSEGSAKGAIEELKGNVPKLQSVIDTPWAKVDELAKNDKDLRDVEAQMAARGISVGDPATGIPIDKYKGVVPVLEDVTDKDGWSFHDGIVYPHQNTTIGVRAKTDLSRFLKSGKLKPSIASSYNAPDTLNALDGGKPQSPVTKPVAYTTINNETRLWVPAGGSYVTVDPVEWNLLQRIIGKEGSWHYEARGMGERFLIHVTETGERDAFIRAKQASYVPQGVKDIDDKGTKTAPAPGQTQYAVGEEGANGSGRMDLKTVQSLFPGQAVSQNGDSFTVTLKNGAQATIYSVMEITPNAVSLNAGYKTGVGKGQFIAGAFGGLDAQGKGIIRIVRDNANAPWTISHESVHWLEKLGVISEMDKATLNARIQKEGKWNKDLSPEENRANWLADFEKGPKPKQTVLAQIWQKIQDFINRLVGIRTAGMIGRELRSGKIFEREGQGTEKGISIFEPVPVFTVTEKGLKKRSRRVENPAATPSGAEPRIPPTGGRVLNFVPEAGTLPAVKSEPIGTWESSRRKIASPEDAAVIARDNLFRDAQEFFVTIVTDKDGDILAVNQHTIGAPNQSQVFSYIVAGQILNVDGAARVWLVHNHPSGTADVSQADLNVSSHIGDLVADGRIDSMPIIAIAPSSYSNGGAVKPLPPKEPAIHKMPLLGRKFDQLPEGLGSITDENALADFGSLYLKDGGMILLSAQRQPVAVIAIDDYSKLRPLHTEILREAEKRNAVDFMIYDTEKTLTQVDIDNLVSFAKNTALDFTTVLDKSGDHYHEIENFVKSAKSSISERTFYSTQADTIDNASIIKAYDEALSAHAYISPRVKPSLSAEEKTIRENAYGVKGMDPAVLDNVAKEMAALIPNEERKSTILVPIPGHTGETTANVALAERIAAITGGRVADVLKRKSGPSQRDARVAGQRTMKPDEFGMVSTETLDGNNVFFVDNVISSGATIRAARDAVGGGKGLVYAKSNPKGEKYAVGTADPELPKWIGDKIKKAFKKDSIVSILLDFGPIQAGPLDGGCLVLARALKRIEPTGKIITIEGHQEDGTWQAEHYGFELNGVMIDGAGHAPSREVWAKRFAKNENLDRPYRITEGQVESDEIVQDVPTEKTLAAALEKELAPDEAYGIGKYDNFGDTAVTDFSADDAWHDIAYREPTKEAIARLNAWLKENQYATVRMYHGTDAGIPVMEEGLKPTSARTAKSLQSSHGTVSLSLFPGMANQFGRLAYPGKEIAVYPVDVLVKNLTPDTDQLRNKRHFGGREDLGDTLAESIAIGHGAKVQGKVPVDWIRPHREQYSVQRDTIDSASIFPEVNERLKAAKGIKYASLKDRAKDALVTGWEHFTRHFQHLEPETDGAVIDVFRKFQDVPAWAKDETVRRLSGFVGKLSPQGREVFTMNILLPDMIRDIENGTLGIEDEGGLPFGYKNRDQVQQDYDHFRAIAEGSPAIMEALDKRNAFMVSLTDQLIQYKLLTKEVANDPAAYFHHQVLAYINYKENPNWGMSSRDVRTHRKGWQVGRKGSQLDYNTEYVESEFEIISQALTQIETVKSLKEIERLADIKPRLEAEAKDQNMATFNRKIEQAKFVGTYAVEEDPLLPFRAKLAVGFQKLAKLFTTENNMGSLPMEFDDVIEHIVNQEEQRRAAKEDEIEFDPVPHPRMFALLNYLINHEGPGSMPAAMIFKAIAARNAFIKQIGGDDWVTYRDMIPEGYVAHKPESGSTFYFTNGIADQALAQVLAGHKSLPDAVRQVMARGRDEEWVVKEGISKTLNEFRPALTDSLPAKISKDMLTTWKQWILMNPFRVIKYNINNMSGDLDIAMAYDPKIITGYFTQAFKDLWAASRGKASEKLMDELSELTKRGVIGSGMTAMDIPELGDVKSVKGLVDFFDGKSKNALTRWYSTSKKLSTLRENILRLAANRYFTDKLASGQRVYGASRKEEVDAIENAEDKAAKLARELVGDYGNISHAGQYIRERMIPFYSWLEINAPRYVRLFRNLRHEGGGGIGAMGGVLAWKTTKLAIKASALMGLVMLWNAAFFPDEEDELQEAGREQLHMILGRQADGSIITLRFQGALSDALTWFGMGNPVEQVKKVVSGTKGVGDLAKEVVKAPSLKLFQGFRPEPKLLYETLSGESFFPDPMHPRPIRDTAEHILRTFSLDRIYNQAAGKPKQGGTWAAQMYRDIQSLALNEADPGEQAYYTSRKYIFDWLDKQGKEKPVAMPTNRSNSLYYYKQALKFGDFDAAEKYLKKYQDMGGKLHDVQGSIRRVHPLASLRLADRYKFKASLSPEQQETLSVATAWYKKHYVDSYQEQRKRGM